MGITQTFGDRLRRLCDDAGAVLQRVDERAGLGKGHTAMLVSGQKSQPVLSTACALARAFGLDGAGALWLLSGEGQPPSADDVRAGFAARVRVHASRIRHPPVSRKTAHPSSVAARAGRRPVAGSTKGGAA